MAGCCVHVASLIYYLSYAKHIIDFKLPAEHLNSVFVNTTLSEVPNQPRYVRNKRSKNSLAHCSRKRRITEESQNEYSEAMVNEQEQEASVDNNATSLGTVQELPEDDAQSQLFETSNDHYQTNGDIDGAISNDANQPEFTGREELLDQPMQDAEHVNPNRSAQSSISLIPEDEFMMDFKEHVPKWSARISYLGQENIYLSNTCSIDYFLLALWSLFKRSPSFVDDLPSPNEQLSILKEKIVLTGIKQESSG